MLKTFPKDEEEQLIQNGYILEENCSSTFEVKNLDNVANKASEIANLSDIERMIDEQVNREYKSSESNEYSWDYQYKIKEEKEMYRQFSKESKEGLFYSGDPERNDGNLIKVYTVERYSGGSEGKLDEKKTVILGFADIKLDKDNKANVSELTEINDYKDDSYSLETVIQLYEGEGYSEVK